MLSMLSRSRRWRWCCAVRCSEANLLRLRLRLTGLFYRGLGNEYVQIDASARGAYAVPPLCGRAHWRTQWHGAGICAVGRVQLWNLLLLGQAGAGHVQSPAGDTSGAAPRLRSGGAVDGKAGIAHAEDLCVAHGIAQCLR